MPSIDPRPWTSWASLGLLVLASPLLLAVAWFVLVDWPWDVAIGLAAVFSGHDVVQTADAEETGVSLLLLLIAVGAVCWLLRVRLPERFAWSLALYGILLVVPIIALLGIATEYGLQALLAARGYRYCTYHVISTDKGGNGTYVYTRNDRPSLCDATKSVFPPGSRVPGRRQPFDLPDSGRQPAGDVRQPLDNQDETPADALPAVVLGLPNPADDFTQPTTSSIRLRMR